MTGRAATPTHYHLRLRIPGWLLATLLMTPLLFLGWKFAENQFDRAQPNHGPPVRVTTLERTLSPDRVATVRMLIETNDELDPLRLRYSIDVQHADGTLESLPTAASLVQLGAWEGHSAVVQVDYAIPEGSRFRSLNVVGPSWSSGVGAAEELYEPRLAPEPEPGDPSP